MAGLTSSGTPWPLAPEAVFIGRLPCLCGSFMASEALNSGLHTCRASSYPLSHPLSLSHIAALRVDLLDFLPLIGCYNHGVGGSVRGAEDSPDEAELFGFFYCIAQGLCTSVLPQHWDYRHVLTLNLLYPSSS